MKNFPIHISDNISLEKLQNGVFIIVFRATRIPPHLSLITAGKLFDITTVGPNKGLDIETVFNTILKRKEEVIFIELEAGIQGVNQVEIITEKVNHYWKVDNEVSCLNPIKDFLDEAYQIEVNQANFIFELLPILNHLALIKGVSQVNLEDKIQEHIFNLKKYTKADVVNCINALKRKETIC